MDEPLKVVISGAPASGKGTQCELIADKFGLSHISSGDLLRAEVAAETESGKRAKQYMDAGELVPDDIVVTMLEDKIAQSENGWLLDGFPRSLSQAEALEAIKVRPQLFILLDVPDQILVERVVGRRSDPVTGKIYHLKYLPPETEEIARRLTQRADDTEEKVKTRLATYHANIEAVITVYKDIIKRVDGNRPMEDVFQDISKLLAELLTPDGNPEPSNDQGKGFDSSSSSPSRANSSTQGAMKLESQVNGSPALRDPPSTHKKENWNGVPTKLNTTPHSR